MEKLERIIKFYPAWDKRSDDPKKNYGIHGVEMKWVVKGSKGAVQFMVFTNWHLPHIQKENDQEIVGLKRVSLRIKYNGEDVTEKVETNIKGNIWAERDGLYPNYHLFHNPMPADIGYHSKVPMYEGQSKMTGKCEYTDGGDCYYDGSGLSAQEVFDILVSKGDEAVWKYLEDYYKERFK